MAIINRPRTTRSYASVPVFAGMLLFAGLLTGCGTGISANPPETAPLTPPTNPTTPTTPSLLLSGKVLAGSQPISGASVQVYAAGTAGNGSAATALLASPVTSDSNGVFSISAGLNCPSTSSMVYLVARGGQVGSASTNTALALTTAVGPCSQLSTVTTTQFTINEVTTVATAWALSQFFGSSGSSFGASPSNAKGLANAFATAANLADPATGKAPGKGFPSNGKTPGPKINTLANLLNTCTAGITGSSNPCDSLFNLAATTGASAPSNTFDATLALARNPGRNVSAIYTQSNASKAFVPSLAVAPSDWTISISFTGGGMNGPTGVAVDGQGNVWVANYFGVVSEFTATGSPVFASGISGYGIQSSYSLAIDGQNNIWIANMESPSSVNKSLGTITELNSSGQPLSGSTGYSAGGLNHPIAIAIDTNSTAWIVDNGNARVTLLSSSGAPLSGAAGYAGSTLAFPAAIAIDANHAGWIGNQNDNYVTRVSPDGAQSSGIACCSGPQGLAIDQSGVIWTANFYGDSVSQISSSGSVISAGYTAEGLYRPQGIAIDGAGSVWVANVRSAAGATNPTLTRLSGSQTASPGTPLSPPGGLLADADMLVPYAVAIDSSGNLWITNFGNNTLTEVVGTASPVRTPLNGPPQVP